MNTVQRIAALENLQTRLRKDTFRNVMVERRDVCGEIAGHLTDLGLHDAALQAAEILSRDGFTSRMYDTALSQLDLLVTTSLTRLRSKLGEPQVARPAGSKIFIGHGGSPLWRELKDFIADRLGLEWEEFNRVAVAGRATAERLSEMLDQSCFAFLVMTAEDHEHGGAMRARQNVVHEAGLFQGHLGFEKAIILLEEGCEEFSNVHGLGQIRFPRGRISTSFEEVRRVLEREKIIGSSDR